MFKIKVHSYWLKSEFEYSKQIELYVDMLPMIEIPNDTIRIIMIQEPVNPKLIGDMINKDYFKFYNYVFTYHKDILDNNQKAVLLLAANTRIQNYTFPEKSFGVSTWLSNRDPHLKRGVQYRRELWDRQNEIKIPKYFYLSSEMPFVDIDYTNKLILGTDKSVMFNTQYHIAFDTISIENMFSEKLIDCFQTKTIPIYYGCTNLQDYFNTDGIILVKNVNEVIEFCNNLKPEIYNTMADVINDNYKKSLAYLSHTQMVDKKLKEIFK
jgi:hypothetical protein